MRYFGAFGGAVIGALAGLSVATAASAQDTMTIGVQVPTTGSEATYGKDMANAVEIAQEEINEKGGVLGKKLTMIIGDSACDPQQAVNAASQAGLAGRGRRRRRLLLGRDPADAARSMATPTCRSSSPRRTRPS